jgi:hypothetical protein
MKSPVIFMRKLGFWGVEAGDVIAFVVGVEASDGDLNCRKETGN